MADTHVRIQPWTDNDLVLLIRANSAEMTAHLGGPETGEAIAARHQRYLHLPGPGRDEFFAIRRLADDVPVGSIGYWERDWNGEPVYEAGWAVLPEFQSQGIATAAIGRLVAHLHVVGRHRWLHAFPSVDNAASNAICRKAGFELLGPHDFEYRGHLLHCNDWRFDLAVPEGA